MVKEDMPRERLLSKGGSALSDAELLAILLRTGIAGKSVLPFARELLEKCGGLAGLLNLRAEHLSEYKGLGKAKTAEILAVTELCKRYLASELTKPSWRFQSVDDVRDYLLMQLKHLPYESLLVLLLDQQHRYLADLRFSEAKTQAVNISFRELTSAVLRYQASAVILVHNHPAGSPSASSQDIEATREIEMFLQKLSVRLLDHFIVAGNQIISLRENGSW